MPTEAPSGGRAVSDPLGNADATRYDEWFQESPDPWEKITELAFGADRTFASMVEIQIVNSSESQWPSLEKKLLAALGKSEGKPAAVGFVCRQLGRVGGAASVDALAGLLKDPGTSNAARIALQPNPSPKASAALREALPVLSGDLLCGLIGTLAARKDAEAAPALEALAADASQPEAVRETADRAAASLRKHA